jgi:Ohr subfamily peroxiredoxin
MSRLDKVLYTAKTHASGGRDGGSARSSDSRLEVRFSRPGGAGEGTNPEQLFAAGWSACFIGAMQVVAQRQKIALPAETAIDAEVDLGPVGEAFGIAARLNIAIPGMDRGVAKELIEAAHKICPYSRATSGNIEVAVNLV